MNGNQILKELKQRSLSFTAIANEVDVSAVAVRQVAHRKSDSIKIAIALSAALDKPIETVFPDRPQYQKQTDPAERARCLAAVRDAVSAAA